LSIFAAGALLDGRYRLVRLIGVGGMGEVWEARVVGPAGFEKRVAVKVIRRILAGEEAMVSLFLDEARLVAKLDHPNLVHIYELGQVDSAYYIIMEYVDGVDLARLMKKLKQDGRGFDRDEALYVVLCLLKALDHAHSATDDEGHSLGVVHRDVSPQNLLLSYRSGTVKLTDFGVARQRDQRHRTEVGVRRGKVAYMAPEQMVGKEVDARADLYAAGLLLFELLTGMLLPPEARTPNVTQPGSRAPRESKATVRAIEIPGLNPELCAVVYRALAGTPEERFGSAREMLETMTPHIGDLAGADQRLARLLEAAIPRAESSIMQAHVATAPAAARSGAVGATESHSGDTYAMSLTPSISGEVIELEPAAPINSGKRLPGLGARQPGETGEAASRPRRRGGLAVVAALVVAAAAVAFGVWWGGRKHSSHGGAASARDAGAAPQASADGGTGSAGGGTAAAGSAGTAVAAAEPQSAVPAAGTAVAAAEPQSAVPAAGSGSASGTAQHKLDPERKPDRRRREPIAPIASGAAPASPTAPAGAKAYLVVHVNRDAEVEVDGRVVGRAPLRRVAVPPGIHRVRVVCLLDGGKRAPGPVRVLRLEADAEAEIEHTCELAPPTP